MDNNLVDFFDLDFNSTTGDWVGNKENLYTSSCTNFLNQYPNQFIFTSDGVDSSIFFTTYYGNPLAVGSYESYLSNQIIGFGYPLVKIESTANREGELNTSVFLGKSNIVSLTNEITGGDSGNL